MDAGVPVGTRAGVNTIMMVVGASLEHANLFAALAFTIKALYVMWIASIALAAAAIGERFVAIVDAIVAGRGGYHRASGRC